MQQPGGTGSKSQHLDGFGTQNRHFGGYRFGIDTRLGEVTAQVPAYLGQCIGHPASAGGTVKLTPESASKTATFEVSKANSTDLPFAAFDAAGTLATNSCSSPADSESTSEKSSDCTS